MSSVGHFIVNLSLRSLDQDKKKILCAAYSAGVFVGPKMFY